MIGTQTSASESGWMPVDEVWALCEYDIGKGLYAVGFALVGAAGITVYDTAVTRLTHAGEEPRARLTAGELSGIRELRVDGARVELRSTTETLLARPSAELRDRMFKHDLAIRKDLYNRRLHELGG